MTCTPSNSPRSMPPRSMPPPVASNCPRGAAADNILALGSHAVVLVEVRMPAEALYDARPPLRR